MSFANVVNLCWKVLPGFSLKTLLSSTVFYAYKQLIEDRTPPKFVKINALNDDAFKDKNEIESCDTYNKQIQI